MFCVRLLSLPETGAWMLPSNICVAHSTTSYVGQEESRVAICHCVKAGSASGRLCDDLGWFVVAWEPQLLS